MIFKYTEISSALPNSLEKAEIDNAVLKQAPNIIKIAAIVVIITTLTQPVLMMSPKVSFPSLYNILNSHSQSLGMCFLHLISNFYS